MVEGAELQNGLLHVGLKRVVPEALKPRRIAISGAAVEGQAVPAIANDAQGQAQAHDVDRRRAAGVHARGDDRDREVVEGERVVRATVAAGGVRRVAEQMESGLAASAPADPLDPPPGAPPATTATAVKAFLKNNMMMSWVRLVRSEVSVVRQLGARVRAVSNGEWWKEMVSLNTWEDRSRHRRPSHTRCTGDLLMPTKECQYHREEKFNC